MKAKQKVTALEKLPAKSRRAALSQQEWNFAGKGVPDEQLVACCYWEYARESVSICNAVKTAKAAYANQGILQPESERREAFRLAADDAFGLLCRTGFDLSFWLALPFPEPWQSVEKSARGRWARINPIIPTPVKIPAFQVTGDIFIAEQLRGEAMKAQKTRQALWPRRSQIEGVADMTEADELREKLSKQAAQPGLRIRGEGGVDSFIAQINWRASSDTEIIASFEQWVKTPGNRPMPVTSEPKGVRGMRGGRGQDPQNWRTSLERLGIMRLMNRHSFDEMAEIVQSAALVQSADREKYSVKATCKSEWGKAQKFFHALFPFISEDENPRSCKPRPGCW